MESNYEKAIEEYGEKEVTIKAIVVSDAQDKEYKDVYQIKVIEIGNNTEENEINHKEAKQVEKASFQLLCNIKKKKINLLP